jgi:phosphoglycerate dehydrogenase-like enzyme
MNTIIVTKNITDGGRLREIIQDSSEVLDSIQNYSKDEIVASPERFKDVKYILSTWYMPSFSEAEITKCFPSLDSIFYVAGSVDYFAESFKNCGVSVLSAIEENSVPVSEFVVAQVILANKGYFQSQLSYKKPYWRLSYRSAKKYTSQRMGNFGAKVGLIGCGCVGMKVLELLKNFNLEVYICDPKISDNYARDLGVVKCDLVEIFKKCDVISNHLPDILETRNILNFDLFSKMKRTATFINTGRGTQVVEGDLIKAMKRKPYACALLDVTRNEPPRPWSPLLWMRNIFLTPHIAGSESHEFQRLVDAMLRAHQDAVDADE